MSLGSYTIEYAKTSRAACQTCKEKIPKGEVRIGKMVDMKLTSNYNEYGTSRILPAWHHYDCFWGPAYIEQTVDEERVWENFHGISDLKVEDQGKLHLKIKGKAMPKTAMKQAVKEEKAAEKLAVYTDSAPDVIIVTMVEKALLDKSKMTDINQLFSTYKINKQKKTRKADLIKILLDTPLSVFPGFVYSCIEKTMTVNDIKSTLQSRNLKVTGAKPALIWRLLETENLSAKTDDIFEWPSAAEKKKKTAEKKQEKRWERGDFSDEGDGYYFSRHDIYKKDDKDSPIVVSSRAGDLEDVSRILKQKRNSPEILNKARKWTEVQEKWGYDKSWEWYGDTPLIAAAGGGHHQIVRLLLLKGADPTLISCPSDDIYVCAIAGRNGNDGAAEKVLSICSRELEQIHKGDLPSYHSIITNTLRADPKDAAKKLLDKIATLNTTIKLIAAAAPFWTSTSSSSANAGGTRSYRTASDAEALKAAVEAVSVEIDVDVSEADRLTESITSLRTKHAKPPKPVYNPTQRFNNRVHARVIPGVMNNGAQGYSALSAAARPFIPTGNHARVGGVTASTRNGQQGCQQSGCDKLFAKACSFKRCASCCTGPCRRHCR